MSFALIEYKIEKVSCLGWLVVYFLLLFYFIDEKQIVYLKALYSQITYFSTSV